MKLTLLYFSIEASFVEIFEYFHNMPVICEYIIEVDGYIIKVDYNTSIQKIGKYIIHKLLKGYKSINKAEQYYRLLE